MCRTRLGAGRQVKAHAAVCTRTGVLIVVEDVARNALSDATLSKAAESALAASCRTRASLTGADPLSSDGVITQIAQPAPPIPAIRHSVRHL